MPFLLREQLEELLQANGESRSAFICKLVKAHIESITKTD